MPDDRQPGGGELRRQLLENLDRGVIDDALGGVPHSHTTLVEGCYRCDLNKDEPGDSRAESTVAQCDWWPAPCQCSAALETAQGEIERLRDSLQRTIDGWFAWDEQLKQSRATEAELRAKVYDVRSLVANALQSVRTGHGIMAEGWLRRALELALDAAEQPRFIGSQNGEKPILNQSEPIDAAEQPARAGGGQG